MTVGELIELLSDYHPDMQVLAYNSYNPGHPEPLDTGCYIDANDNLVIV